MVWVCSNGCGGGGGRLFGSIDAVGWTIGVCVVCIGWKSKPMLLLLSTRVLVHHKYVVQKYYNQRYLEK